MIYITLMTLYGVQKNGGVVLNFENVVKNISTLTDLKRSCGMYVIDYRNLDKSELENALIKTSPHFYIKIMFRRF